MLINVYNHLTNLSKEIETIQDQTKMINTNNMSSSADNLRGKSLESIVKVKLKMIFKPVKTSQMKEIIKVKDIE